MDPRTVDNCTVAKNVTSDPQDLHENLLPVHDEELLDLFRNPNDGHLPSWPQFTKEGGDYLDLGEITQGKKCFNKDNLEFWNALDKL